LREINPPEAWKPTWAQGIEAEIPEQTAKWFVRNWSGKPGFLRPDRKKCAIKTEKKVNAEALPGGYLRSTDLAVIIYTSGGSA
jgi:Rieske Fe-S protein